jgi:hypothetical protein
VQPTPRSPESPATPVPQRLDVDTQPRSADTAPPNESASGQTTHWASGLADVLTTGGPKHGSTPSATEAPAAAAGDDEPDRASGPAQPEPAGAEPDPAPDEPQADEARVPPPADSPRPDTAAVAAERTKPEPKAATSEDEQQTETAGVTGDEVPDEPEHLAPAAVSGKADPGPGSGRELDISVEDGEPPEPDRAAPTPAAVVGLNGQAGSEEVPTEAAAPGDRANLDELFARIKAERGSPAPPPGDGEQAATSPEDHGATVAVVDEPTPTATPAGDSAPAAEGTPLLAGDDEESDAALLRERDAELEGIERTLARRLKRVLADEQNEVFDLLRRSMPATLDDLVPERAAHVERYARVAVTELDSAAGRGAAAIGGDQARSCAALSVKLGDALVEPMRERVVRSLEESGGDLDEVTGRLRALYREWKSQRIGNLVRHYAAAAFAAGAYDAAGPGAELRWLVDRTGELCPDADDNALATGVSKGQPFPTGDRCAPAHPGCRCLVIPVTVRGGS